MASSWIRVPSGGTKEQPSVYTSIRESLRELSREAETAGKQIAELQKRPVNTAGGPSLPSPVGPVGLPSLGTANQIFGVNAAASLNEYKTFSGTTNQVSIAHGAGTVTFSLPQDIHTAATPTLAGLTLTGFSGVVKAATGVLSGSATTSDLPEGTNEYYTAVKADARVQAAISITTPASLGVAAVGIGTTWARADHVHAMPTAADVGAFANPMTTLGDTLYGAASGVATRIAGNTTTTRKFLRQTGDGVNSAAPAWDTLLAADVPGIASPAALTKTDDTNVTLTLGGAPTTALLAATSLTLGWTGVLAVARGGSGVTTAAANQFFASPDGAPGAPGFRAMVTADLPATAVLTTGSYADPAWITSLAGSKITGNITGSATNVTGTVAIANGGTGITSYTAGDLIYASGVATLTLLAAGTSGYVLTSGGVGMAPSWTAAGTGTVTSVGLTMPSEFLVTNSPVTTSGTIVAGWDSVAANTVLAGMDGMAGVPSFRSLAAADIPNLDVAKITTGVFAPVRGGTGVATFGGVNRILYTSATDVLTSLAGNDTSTRKFLRQVDDGMMNPTAPAWDTLAAGDIPNISATVGAIGTNLVVIAALPVTDNNIIVGNGSAWVAESGATARTSLGLTIGTDVQAYNASLAAIAAGTWTGATSIATVGTITSGVWNAGVGTFTSATDPQVTVTDTGHAGFKALATGDYVAYLQLYSTANRNWALFSGITGDSPGNFVVKDDTSGTKRFEIDSSGNFIINGTITSGVWNAGAITSSGGISGTTGTFSGAISCTSNAIGITSSQGNAVEFGLNNTDGRNYALVSWGSAAGGGTLQGKFSLYDNTAGAHRWVVDTNGNLLLGTTTAPSANSGKVMAFGDNAADPTMGASTVGLWNNGGTLKTSGALAPAGNDACRVYLSGNQSANDVTYTAVAFNAESYDTNTMHDNVTNNSRVTIKKAGIYLVNGHLSFGSETTSAGTRRAVIMVNGVVIAETNSQSRGGLTGVEVTAVLNLAVNDYVELKAYQDSGATQTISGVAELTYMDVTYLRGAP